MGNRYSAQNVSSYLIQQLKDISVCIDSYQLQQLLQFVDLKWQKVYGHCAFLENAYPLHSYYIKEVNDTYLEQFGNGPIHEPAREWYLPYGQFVVEYRPYRIPSYSPFEKVVMNNIVLDYVQTRLKKVS
jgi:hypothetical protein